MDDEVLDWDDGEDQAPATTGPIDDADGVSLGSDSGDESENLAPPVEEASAPAHIASPSTQDANSASRPASPKSSTLSQRKDSYSSLRTTKSINSISAEPPKTLNRSQRLKSKPLSSAQMIMHGLPPKPVTSAVSFLPSSQSSLIEATAMVTRETAKGKGGGGSTKSSAAKPVYKEDVDTLPLNWEIRHPRSGGKQVYYYNNRTHESTWTHPSKLQSSRGHPSDSLYPSQGSLSLEDRYYRPGDRRDGSPGDANERSNRYPSPGSAASHRRSPSRDPLPYVNHPRRSISPERGRDSGRRSRSSQPMSAKEYHHANRDRDTGQNSDRRRSPSPPKDFEDSKSRPPQRQRMQVHSHEAQMRDSRFQHERPTFKIPDSSRWGAREDRGQDLHEPTVHNSIHRHRSPSPIREERVDEWVPSTSTIRKRRTRFGTPPDVAIGSDHEDWVPDEFKVERSTDQARPQEITASNVPDSVHSVQPIEQLTRRQRAPLPPQSARFREVSRHNLPPVAGDLPTPVVQEQVQAHPPSPLVRSQLPIVNRDPPPHQRASNFGSPMIHDSIASSNRHRNQSSPVRYQERNTLVLNNAGLTRSTDDQSSFTPRITSNGSTENTIRQGSGTYTERGRVEDEPTSQLPKAPRAMGRDDTTPTAPRSSSARERSPRGSDRDPREVGPLYHPDRSRKEDLTGNQGRGRGSRGRPAPHLSGTNNVPVGNRIGADGIPNGPARTSNNIPRVPLSSANMIPVTNNRYTESSKVNEEIRSPAHIRNGGVHVMRSNPLTTAFERDTSNSRGRVGAVDVTMPLKPRSTSPLARNKEISPPTPSREVTISPSWERESDRAGRSAHGRTLEPSDSMSKYPSREGLDSHERSRHGQGLPEHRLSANDYRPPSPSVNSMPSRHLPAKPVQQPSSDHSRPRGSRPSPQRHWSPEARYVQLRDITPQRDRLPTRSVSPVEPRGQRRDSPPQRWPTPRRSLSPFDSRGSRRALSPQRDRTPPKRQITPEARGPRHLDVQLPRTDRSETLHSQDHPPKLSGNHHRASDVRESVDMDVDNVPPRQYNDNGKRDQRENYYGRPSVNRRGGSLLDRLSISVEDQVPLRDRVQIPTKRDRDELMRDGGSFSRDIEMDDGIVGKKPRRRSGKPRRGRGRGPGGQA